MTNAPVAGQADAPSLGVVVLGGLGVLAAVAFVGALALGGGPVERPGDRVAVARADAPGGLVVVAGRCLEQRVVAVEVAEPDGAVRWRVTSEKGSIERLYPVGDSPPLGFDEVTALEGGPLTGPVRVALELERADGEPTADARTVDMASLPDAPPDLGAAPGPCGKPLDLGPTTVVFAAAAAVVVGGYVVMVRRRWRP